MPEPSISVVIPTFNPGAELRALLEGLARQARPASEILLIDSSPDPAAARRLAGEFDTRFERVGPEGFGHGRTRNRAAGLCSGELIAFFTQDALPADEDVLGKLSEAVLIQNVAGAYARQLPREDATAKTRAEVLEWFEGGSAPMIQEPLRLGEWHRLSPMARYRRARFDNVASMVRAEALRVRPFPETWFGEDISWGKRVIENGHALAYAPAARVIHSHDRSAGYEFKRTVNCHARLRELFGLETLPHLSGALSGFVRESLSGIAGAASLEEAAKLPPREAARAFGQYFGARLSRLGLAGRIHFRGI